MTVIAVLDKWLNEPAWKRAVSRTSGFLGTLQFWALSLFAAAIVGALLKSVLAGLLAEAGILLAACLYFFLRAPYEQRDALRRSLEVELASRRPPEPWDFAQLAKWGREVIAEGAGLVRSLARSDLSAVELLPLDRAVAAWDQTIHRGLSHAPLTWKKQFGEYGYAHIGMANRQTLLAFSQKQLSALKELPLGEISEELPD